MHEAYWRRVMELHPTYSYFGRGKVIYDGEHEVDLYVNKEFGRARLHLILDSKTEDPSKIPEEINCISGKLINGYEFTLLNCKQLGFFYNFEKIMFFFEADFLIEEIVKNEIEPKFNKMSFYIKNALDWGGIYDFSSNRIKLPQGVEERKLIYTSDEFQATYYVWYNKFTVNEDEPFVQSLLNNTESVIEISCSENKPIGYFIDKVKCIIQLIELSTSRKQELNRIEAFCEQTNVEEDANLDKNRISVFWREQIPFNFLEKESYAQEKLITLDYLKNKHAITRFFEKYDRLKIILELYIESIFNVSSSELMFLRIMQALESYSATFKEKKKKPRVVLRDKLRGLLFPESGYKFNLLKIDEKRFIDIVVEYRNYFTHHGELKEIDDADLPFKSNIMSYNYILLNILEYHLFNELIPIKSSNLDTAVEYSLGRWALPMRYSELPIQYSDIQVAIDDDKEQFGETGKS